MSNIYVSEPPTKGKVVINTTHGPLDIELWPKEAPKAVRNFVQLCLEGYYDSNIFHRIIKEFLVQSGDPTGTGKGGESIYGGSFSDEFHTRLRFSHRGIVACANAGTPHSNGSQFFVSLARCDWLDRKNTIFGKVTGDSLYNLVNIGELETDENDRPFDPPPKITSVEVIWNPFEDIVPRVVVSKSLAGSTSDADNKNEKKKGVKKLNLLSFGEEAEEEEKELATVKQQKIKSSHDVLNDPRLLKAEDSVKELDSSEIEAARNRQLSVREALSVKKEELPKNLGLESSNPIDNSDDDEVNFDVRMRQKILTRRMEQGDVPTKKKSHHGNPSTNDNRISASRPNAESSDDEKPKKEKLYIKKRGIGSDARAERMAKGDTDLQLLGEAERGRHLQKQKQRRLQGREDDVLARLAKFKQTLSGEPTATQSVPEGDGDGNDWKYVQLKFAPDSGKNGMTRNEDPNDYVVHDPLLEKGKEKFNKMQAKQKRREREWAGKSLA